MTGSAALLSRYTLVSIFSAGFLLAHQLAGKAARDGLFLSRFPASELPRIAALSAVMAVILGLGFSRLLARWGPRIVVPAGLLASGLLHLGEYFALRVEQSLAITFIYLHIVGLGAVLLSGFWSLANEVFDPREAKLRFGRIAGGGTAGGILGGVAAERTVTWASAEELLLLLAAAHGIAAVLTWWLARGAIPHPARPGSGEPVVDAARQAFRQAPFLSSLAILVLLGTTGAALVDYLFKSGAASTFGRGPGLTRFFALYYTGAQILTFAVQSLITPWALNRLGLGRTVTSLPLVVAAGSLASLYVPAYGMIAGLRGLELILRGSFFRSGYELFFTPIPAGQKRAVKTIIDVGCDRMGDAVGAAALQLLLLLGPAYARTEILLITTALAGLSIWLASRMDAAYSGALAQGLRSRAQELDLADVEDNMTMSVVLQSRTLAVVRDPGASSSGTLPAVGPRVEQTPRDPVLESLRALRSADPAQVRHELAGITRWEPLLAPQVIRLLAWDEVSEGARQALTQWGDPVVGQLTDSLLDENQDFAIRRRIPRILARRRNQRAVEGLLAALEDPRFEIRFQSSRALDYLRQHAPQLRFPADVIHDAVNRELGVSRPIWDGRKLLDSRDGADSSFYFLDDVLRERTSQSLEHVFSLLAVLLPRDPLKTAFRALHSEDRLLRGLGLEYLSSTLPEPVYAKLTALVEQGAHPPPGASNPAP